MLYVQAREKEEQRHVERVERIAHPLRERPVRKQMWRYQAAEYVAIDHENDAYTACKINPDLTRAIGLRSWCFCIFGWR
jgi:hypothetical protein